MFECLLEDAALDRLRKRLEAKVVAEEDSVRIYRLCADCRGKVVVGNALIWTEGLRHGRPGAHTGAPLRSVAECPDLCDGWGTGRPTCLPSVLGPPTQGHEPPGRATFAEFDFAGEKFEFAGGKVDFAGEEVDFADQEVDFLSR